MKTLAELAESLNISVFECRRLIIERRDLAKREGITRGRFSVNDTEIVPGGHKVKHRVLKISNPHRRIITDDSLAIPVEYRVDPTNKRWDTGIRRKNNSGT